jgi:hypothetical protein
MSQLNSLQRNFEIFIHFSIYLFVFLLILGCGNSILTLMVLSHSKGKRPRIAGSLYLNLLNISNFLFLIFHFFVITSQLIIVYYDLNKHFRNNHYFRLLNLINLNVFTCKTFNYFYTVTRSFSTFLTLYFTFERGFATFCPIKMMQLKPYFSQIYFFSTSGLLCITLLISTPELFTYDLVEFYFGNNFNRTAVILCDIKIENIQIHETFRFHYCIVTLIIPFFLIIFVNVIIGLGLKRRNSLISNDLLMSMEKNLRKSSSKVKFIVRNDFDEINYLTPRESVNAPLATVSEVNLKGIENEKNSNEKHSSNGSILTSQVSKEIRRKDLFLNKIRNRNSNTNLLVTITTAYAFFNFPYLFNLLYIFINRDEFVKNIDSNMVELFKYKYHIATLFSEIFYMANYSVNGIILFGFGKIYQIHLRNLIKKIYDKII